MSGFNGPSEEDIPALKQVIGDIFGAMLTPEATEGTQHVMEDGILRLFLISIKQYPTELLQEMGTLLRLELDERLGQQGQI